MTMTRAEYAQLRKCMARTTSDSDAEALASIRRANALLAKHSLDWDKVFDRTVRVVDPVEVMEDPVGASDPPTSPRARDGHRPPAVPHISDDSEDWDRLFDDAMAGAQGSFLETLESIHAQWEQRGWISERQKQVVREAAKRHAERHPGGR